MVTIVAMSMVALVAWPASVSAHTEFVASVPEDGAVLEAPVATVTLEFTNPAVESGAGFEVLGSDGAIREPTSLDPTDGTMFIATFEPPLDVGVYGNSLGGASRRCPSHPGFISVHRCWFA